MAGPPADVLRVFLDVSHLGHVQTGPRNSTRRTGLHRVVEQTVRWVSADPGVDVTLVAPGEWESALAYVRTHPELDGLRFPVPGRQRLAAGVRRWAASAFARAGQGRAAALPARVVNRLTGDANRAIDRVMLAFGFSDHAATDVFHSPLDPLPGSRQRSRSVRYVLTVYDLIPILFPEVAAGWEGDRWIRTILASIGPEDHVLAISEHTRSDLLNVVPTLSPERVHVTPLAADAAVFAPCVQPGRLGAVRARYGLPLDAPYLLSVASLAPHKNLPALVRAFGALVRSERIDELRLVLVGARAWGADAVFAALDALGDVRDRVLFTGYVDDADLAPLYTGALAFVYPSLYEGFGLPPLEAMQCGTPVITSNTSSLPEVVGDAGLLVDPRDGDALAQALLDVYRDPTLRADLARRSLARARTFSWDKFARQTVAAYRAPR